MRRLHEGADPTTLTGDEGFIEDNLPEMDPGGDTLNDPNS
jgi:hypothetical protein